MKEDSGTFSGEVKFIDIKRTGKWRRLLYYYMSQFLFCNHFITDVEVQKHGDQTGLDTLVVHALTDEC